MTTIALTKEIDMSKSDLFGGFMLLFFGLGFINIFGAQYTWWALMKYLAT
jgi:hypothetical protein